ncbi:MAG TPA: teicoplanin resistance protein VanZ [Deltaproteobacteria bacterium]|nr:MAG: hypothetical protein A2048_00780 [Deltaproteobacteria bacterium GWA2_45_12]HBF12192.1 teicoplanin resistance protein VanZ [Deltaproteobacteria bacterium]
MRHFRYFLRQNIILLWAPVVCFYGLIFYLSSQPPESLNIPHLFEGFDKLLHFFEFGMLGLFVMRSVIWERYYHHWSKRSWLYTLLLIGVLALGDEYHQSFVPGREVSFWDWLADIGGGIIAIVGGRLLYRKHVQRVSALKT